MRNAISAALVLTTLHLTTLALWTACTPTQAPAQLMPAVSGAISELAIQFHDSPGSGRFLAVYGQMFAALSPGTLVHVVVSDASDEAMFQEARLSWFPEGDGPEVQYTLTGFAITSWMRDRLAVLDGEGDTVLLVPALPMRGPAERAQDWRVPWTLAEHLGEGVVARRSFYNFDGGDLIADGERVYVGSPLFGRNVGMDRDALLAELEADLNREVLALLDTPDHHIGMFLTPLGDGRVAVGDVDLGLALLEGAGLAPTVPLEVGGIDFAPELDQTRLNLFRGVISQLEDAGIEVVRIPLVPSTEPYVWLSYNNLMAETREDGLHVYLPVYDVAPLDEAAIAAWEGIGATVHPIRVEGLFRLGGSVRCLVAPVERV